MEGKVGRKGWVKKQSSVQVSNEGGSRGKGENSL